MTRGNIVAPLLAALALGCGASVDTSGELPDEPQGLPCDEPLPCEVDAGEGPRCCHEGLWGFCDEQGTCELVPSSWER